MTEPVHHPNHYTWRGEECLTIISAMTDGSDGYEGYCIGNIIKYLYRYPRKGDMVQDLEKAREYMDMLIRYFKGEDE